MLTETGYDRQSVVEYARKWAYSRNPRYYDFHDLGGDCTNFASQCVFAGVGVMNFTPISGWYYITVNDRTASWTGVEFFHDFLVNNDGTGPYGYETDIDGIESGDIIQLGDSTGDFYHTLVVVATQPQIFVAAHTQDAFMRPLSSYSYDRARFIHIHGGRMET